MIAFGAVVIAIGLVAFAFQWLSIDVANWLGGSGWTLFIIVPGLVLLALGVPLRDGAAQAVTIAGAAVTTVGLLLLFQDQTGRYESWAYAWALIPAAVGLALVVNGLRFDRRDLVTLGSRLVAGFGIALLFGAWYFETVFQNEQPPFDFGNSWPIALIVLGGVVLVIGLLRGSAGGDAEESA
jgi:hypothetical protein